MNTIKWLFGLLKLKDLPEGYTILKNGANYYRWMGKDAYKSLDVQKSLSNVVYSAICNYELNGKFDSNWKPLDK